jgi:hypothetical protein
MWTCPLCNREFVNSNQVHSCNEKDLSDFLNGKSQHTIDLFFYFLDELRNLGEVKVYPTKSMISFAANKRFAYVIQLGKNFIDVVFPFKQVYNDNLCFNKIKQVPGTDDYNHHLRLYFTGDLNEEVKKFIGMAYEQGMQIKD